MAAVSRSRRRLLLAVALLGAARAAALGQTQLLASIERDLRTLEPGVSP